MTTRLDNAVEQRILTVGEAAVIRAYPAVYERVAEGSISLRRAVRVAQARKAQQSPQLTAHFARYSPKVVQAIGERLAPKQTILDPMAGTLERLAVLELAINGSHDVYGVELEPEWASYSHPRLACGDARDLRFLQQKFDVIAVSPSWGNRDADRTGEWWDNADRRTYAAALGRNVTRGSLCLPFDDVEYKRGHRAAWTECARVLRPGGRFFINVKDHIRNGKEVHVSAWHWAVLHSLGLHPLPLEHLKLHTLGRMSGANHTARVTVENLYVFKKES